MTREPIEVTRQDRIYCLKVSSDYHSEVCEECRFYPNCDHMTQDDMTELTIKDLETLEQEPTAKNDLAVDKLLAGCEKMSYEIEIFNKPLRVVALDAVKNIVKGLPSVTPQEPQSFEWCTSCREYDQEKHCCHRWSKVIRNTVEEMKQEYIEREVLDKIREEIKVMISSRGFLSYSVRYINKEIDKVFDKYKAENNS